MKPSKDTNPSWTKTSTTTKDELKLVCKKIADVDALWRMSASRKSPRLKRAA